MSFLDAPLPYGPDQTPEALLAQAQWALDQTPPASQTAQATLYKLLDLYPQTPPSELLMLAMHGLLAMGHGQKLIPYCMSLLAGEGDTPRLWILTVTALACAGGQDYEGALRYARAVLARDEGEVALRVVMARWLYHIGEIPQAISQITQILRQPQNAAWHPACYEALGLAWYGLDAPEKATQAWLQGEKLLSALILEPQLELQNPPQTASSQKGHYDENQQDWQNLTYEGGRGDLYYPAYLKPPPLPMLQDKLKHHLEILCKTSPTRASPAYIRHLFDHYAANFDEDLQGVLDYRAPQILAELLEKQLAGQVLEQLLDLGCGTGLSGQALRPFAKILGGIDLSPAMLAKAKARGVYDWLIEGEMINTLATLPTKVEGITSVDALVYCGDLAPLMAPLKERLLAGGYFLASFETLPPLISPSAAYPADKQLADQLRAPWHEQQNQGWQRQESQRFAHAPNYVCAQLQQAGLEICELKEFVPRYEKRQALRGFAVLARRN
jgi:predicted TPR repeat methyltransferase